MWPLHDLYSPLIGSSLHWLLLVLSFLVIPQIRRIYGGVVTLVTFIGPLTAVVFHHQSAKVCVREFNKSGAASVGARFILKPINWNLLHLLVMAIH